MILRIVVQASNEKTERTLHISFAQRKSDGRQLTVSMRKVVHKFHKFFDAFLWKSVIN